MHKLREKNKWLENFSSDFYNSSQSFFEKGLDGKLPRMLSGSLLLKEDIHF